MTSCRDKWTSLLCRTIETKRWIRSTTPLPPMLSRHNRFSRTTLKQTLLAPRVFRTAISVNPHKQILFRLELEFRWQTLTCRVLQIKIIMLRGKESRLHLSVILTLHSIKTIFWILRILHNQPQTSLQQIALCLYLTIIWLLKLSILQALK